MDALFEAQFSPLADSGRLLSKCGKCIRYMKYIFTQPPRLYCGTCEDVYYLPQKGTVKVRQITFEDVCYLYSEVYLVLFLKVKSYSWYGIICDTSSQSSHMSCFALAGGRGP